MISGTDGDLVATSANVRVSTGRTPRTGDGGGDDDDDGGVVMVSVADSGPPAPAATAAPPTLTEIYRDREREKKSRLPKFKGLDELKLTVKAWLKAVKNELRRQAAILHTEWCEHEVFFEMVASFEGEALQWFDTVEDSFVSREDQTFGNLRRLLKDRYMVKRSNPEVVVRLRLRRQQRGEPTHRSYVEKRIPGKG
ncbi:Retrovirus Polyprotein [Phytophthora cinnamomi]|uniref:Retrovirus Polyprotein n=1 Tax=Phytophthora cinnamomi TaxID=4785 RepID=UPI003559834D|nr:Retrovirus Polyprotein [Phytophthora cinnamomi]